MKTFPWLTNGLPESDAVFSKRCRQQRESVALLPSRPLISIVLNDDGKIKRATDFTKASLVDQSYQNFEIVDHFNVDKAKGEWLVFISAGDILSPLALFSALTESFKKPRAAMFYSHEATLTHDGKHIQRYFSKPRFSWFTLLHSNYIGKFWMVKREWWDKLSGFRASVSLPEHDFFLRLYEAGAEIELLPLCLYYRAQAKPLVTQRCVDIVQEHLQRIGIEARVMWEEKSKRILVRPQLASPVDHLVSVIICFRDRADCTVKSVQHIARHAGRVPLEIFLVNNRSSEAELAKVRDGIRGVNVPLTIVEYPGEFNFADMHNTVVKEHCRGKYLLLLNNDVFWENGNIDEMVEWAQNDLIGTVGVCLRYPHGDIQHSGFRALFGGNARVARLGNNYAEDVFTYQSREVYGSTFAASLFKRSTFIELGGLRPFDLPNGFGDLAFNFECLRRGLKNIYLGGLGGVHLESATRGATDEYWEECIIEREYPEMLQRMLREDLGYNLVPHEDLVAPAFAREWFLVTIREKLPWLKPLKTWMKKSFRALGLRGAQAS